MKKRLVSTVVFVLVAGAPWGFASAEESSEASEAPSLTLSTGWRIHRGDDPRWSDPSFDDSLWKSVAVGRAWERTGDEDFSDYDGFAWYRVKFRVPETWRDDPRLERNEKLCLQLGRIDDVDETFLNGKSIGKTGSFPEDYSPAWQAERRYLLVPDAIRWGQDNVIAVRVYDGARDGGLYRGPYSLSVCSWRDLVSLRIGTGRGDGIYPSGQAMMLKATLTSAMRRRLEGEFRWKIETDEKGELVEHSDRVSLKTGDQPLSFKFVPPGAGFYHVTCRFVHGKEEVTHSMTLGYAPEKIEVPLTGRPDLKAFWAEALDELKNVPPRFQITHQPAESDASRNLYVVEMRSLDDVRVRGWYEAPTKPGKYPAILRVPGYGQDMRPTGRFDDMIVFSFNVRAHGNSQDDLSGEPRDYWIRGLDDKRDYYYRGAYMDCVRAVDFLVSRDEVDANRIAVMGASQGGGMSFATAALDHRVRLCAPDIPFLADWENYFKLSKWPEMDGWIEAREKRTWASTLETLSYFDTMNMAPWIECPVFMGVGLQDPVCPPATVFAVFNRVPGQKQVRVYPHARHEVGREHHDLVYAWIRERFAVDVKTQ